MIDLLAAVDGARWVLVDRPHARLFVWKTGPTVAVVAATSGQVLDEWPCDGTAVSAELVVAERVNQGY